MKRHVEFVSYSGAYPNLCSGTLILRIDGKEVSFGDSGKYKEFWSPVGQCYFTEDWNPVIKEGGWQVNDSDLPEKYQDYYYEIAAIINANMPRSCCGGCL